MNEPETFIPTHYAGWQNYQRLLAAALADLTPEQLELRAAPGLRSIGVTTAHIIAARAGWFYKLLGEGGDEFAALDIWDRDGQPARTAAELVGGLEATWRGMHAAIARWSPADWAKTYPNQQPMTGEPNPYTPAWVIWHLIEHDLHHGGEISLILGMHGLKAPEL